MSNILQMVKFSAEGLIPAITQDIRTDEVLMLAYMNEESLKKTIETGKAHYFSRSRQKLWLKGETSGHFQQIRSISLDCDGDTLLLKVEQTGAACHTGHRSCFFTRFDSDALIAGVTHSETADDETEHSETADDETEHSETAQNDTAQIHEGAASAQASVATAREACDGAGSEALKELYDVILDRLTHPKEGSYTNYLFDKGLDKILKKIGEEACEVVIASKNGASSEIKAEIADLLYHVMVLLVERGLTLQNVYEELRQRK